MVLESTADVNWRLQTWGTRKEASRGPAAHSLLTMSMNSLGTAMSRAAFTTVVLSGQGVSWLETSSGGHQPVLRRPEP